MQLGGPTTVLWKVSSGVFAVQGSDLPGLEGFGFHPLSHPSHLLQPSSAFCFPTLQLPISNGDKTALLPLSELLGG